MRHCVVMATSMPRRPLLRRPFVWILLAVGAVLVVVALSLFQPWKLFVNREVDEALPVGTAPLVPGPSAAPTAPAEPVVLATGQLISHEHASSGSVRILQLADGSRVLRLENLRTSDGPLLKVWLTDAPVIPGRDGWYVFDDGRVTDLGELKGNVGSSNYPIPADVELDGLTSVSIWCDSFDVSFAAAALA